MQDLARVRDLLGHSFADAVEPITEEVRGGITKEDQNDGKRDRSLISE